MSQVIHGDCVPYMAAMLSDSVDCIITDPPYNVVNRSSAGLRSFDKGVADSADINIDELASEFVRLARHSIYVWCGTEQASAWRAAFVEHGLTTRQCVWVKSNPAPTNGQHLWLSGVELCIYARKPKAFHNRHCKSPAWTGPSQRVAGFKCPKPVWLFRELIQSSVPPGGIVFDPFAGSGTTAIAALHEGADYLVIEKEAEFVHLIESRVNALRSAS